MGFTNFSPGAVVFDDPSDPVREFEFLAMNETVSVYFYVDYSAVCDNPIGGGSCAFDGHSASYSVTVTSTAPTATHNGTVISDCMQTTNSAGQATSFILGQNAYVGQFVEQYVTYEFGNNSNLAFQPQGLPGFEDQCYRLVEAKISALNGNFSGISVDETGLLFAGSSSASMGGAINEVEVVFNYEILDICAPALIQPWANAKSGGPYKFTSWSTDGTAPPIGVDPPVQGVEISKSVSPAGFVATDLTTPWIATWTVTLENTTPAPGVDVRVDAINDLVPGVPDCMTLVDAFAGGDVTAEITVNTPALDGLGNITWEGFQPDNLGDNHYIVPAGRIHHPGLYNRCN